MNRIKDYGKLARDITAWIKNYAESNNISSLVVGVSGGIDSAVVSTLCAMTDMRVYMQVFDCFSNTQCINRANSHCNWLYDIYGNNIYYLQHNLVASISGIHIPSPLSTSGFTPEHIWANTKSRLMMIYLYNYASAHNGIVVGTGNKVEDFGIGFFTKYGDGGVDISPIADLYKTEVRELGKYLGISQEIIDAAPTDGLFTDGRTDEQQIGCTYEELEDAMEYDRMLSVANGEYEPILTQREEYVLYRYQEMNRKNQHKMLPIPIFKLNTNE